MKIRCILTLDRKSLAFIMTLKTVWMLGKDWMLEDVCHKLAVLVWQTKQFPPSDGGLLETSVFSFHLLGSLYCLERQLSDCTHGWETSILEKAPGPNFAL